MNSPVDPDNADLARPEPRSRDVDRTEGLSTIVAVEKPVEHFKKGQIRLRPG
jgi:hypothetical protein